MRDPAIVTVLTDRSEEIASETRASTRLTSLDLVRGVAMILMAIDHVRVYSGVPAGGPTAGLFFTRWITHFVAPTFVFLAGTAAYLHGRRFVKRAALSQFLLTRGMWLVFLELTILRLCWTFNFDFAHYMLAGVIWMIGWSMIILAAAVYLPTTTVGVIGVSIVALHNLADLFRGQLEHAFGSNGPNWLLKGLYYGWQVQIGSSGPSLFILYVLVPWVGVMFAGYAFGRVTELPPERRRRIYFQLGATLVALFVELRIVGVYGDPRPWGSEHTLFGFLNTTKYPASLEFLLMTLGPMFILWALAERWNGAIASVIETFGRVPLFYYLLHIPLIHFAACIVSIIREGHVDHWLFANFPLIPGPPPAGYTWSLSLLYLVFVLCVVSLYFPCLWYARRKQASRSRWLSLL